VSRIAFISVRFRSRAETCAEKDLRLFTWITSEWPPAAATTRRMT